MPVPDEAVAVAVRELVLGRDKEENFHRVFVSYHRAVSGFFARRGFPPDDCLDLTQEVFVAAYKGIDGLRSEAAFATWLFSIARFTMLHHLERGQKHRATAASAEWESVPEPGPGPLDRMLYDERVDRMREALEELPGRVQDCLRARLADGLSNREIGQRLGISENTVAVHVHRGLKNLRARLKPFFGEADLAGDL